MLYSDNESFEHFYTALSANEANMAVQSPHFAYSRQIKTDKLEGKLSSDEYKHIQSNWIDILPVIVSYVPRLAENIIKD